MPAAEDLKKKEKWECQEKPEEDRRNEGASINYKRSEGGEREMVTLLSYWSDCWQAFALAASYFKHCFSFFNCLFFSQRCFLLLFLLLFVAIASSILLLSSQSASIHLSKNLFSELYSALSKPTFKSLIGLMYMPMIRKIRMVIFKVFLASFCFNSFSKLLIV